MKLVVVMCVEEFVDKARTLLKKVGVNGFSESEMQGYKLEENDETDNWFADKHLLESSHIFFTICKEEKAEQLLKEVENFQSENNTNRLHAVQLAVEKFVI